MTDVDKVAEAIYLENLRQMGGDITPTPWEDTPAGGKDRYRAMAQAAIDAMGLEVDEHPNAPVWVLDFNEDGSPIMDDRMMQPFQKSHLEWVTKRRWVTAWEEVGERETSEQLSARLEGSRE